MRPSTYNPPSQLPPSPTPSTLRELWKTESRCSSQAERLREQAVAGKLRRSGQVPMTPRDSDEVH